MIVVTVCAAALCVGVIIFLSHLINSTAAKLIDAYGKQEGLVCSVSDQNIIIVRDNRPLRVISWNDITEMSEGKTAFFIKEGENGLMILDKEKVLSGSVSETSELIAQKLGAAK